MVPWIRSFILRSTCRQVELTNVHLKNLSPENPSVYFSNTSITHVGIAANATLEDVVQRSNITWSDIWSTVCMPRVQRVYKSIWDRSGHIIITKSTIKWTCRKISTNDHDHLKEMHRVWWWYILEATRSTQRSKG